MALYHLVGKEITLKHELLKYASKNVLSCLLLWIVVIAVYECDPGGRSLSLLQAIDNEGPSPISERSCVNGRRENIQEHLRKYRLTNTT